MTFSQQLEFGQIGEGVIANWFKARGWAVLPIYEKEMHEFKGPQVFTLGQNLIAPDMFIFNGQPKNALFVEAKTKSVFSWYRKGARWVTGIDLRHYRDYQKVEKMSPWDIWVLFLHLHDSKPNSTEPFPCPTGLYGQKLNVLTNRESHRSQRWARGMVYWDVKHLIKMARLDELSI